MADLGDADGGPVRMTQEALDLALTAVHFDSHGNYLGAADYYDKAILALDEVLIHLEPLKAESRLLLARRALYDDRLEVLRQYIDGASSETGGGTQSLDESSAAAAAATSTLSSPKTRQSLNHRDQFVDTAAQIEDTKKSFEMPPKSLVALPYWQLRMIQRTIERGGGLLSPSLYFPQQAWRQHQLKFSGLAVKMAAFQDIVSTINTVFVPASVLPPIEDVTGMHRMLHAYNTVYLDLLALQTQLARSFPFIDHPAASASSAGGMGGGASSPEAPPTETLTKMAAGFLMAASKTVRKTLETGMFRFNALPASVGEEEFAGFTAVLGLLCDKAQVFDQWYTRLDNEREDLLRGIGGGGGGGGDGGGSTRYTSTSSASAVAQRVSDIEACLTSLCHIAVFMRDVVCNIVLRDMAMLLERYLHKMRKSFARMHWEADAETGGVQAGGGAGGEVGGAGKGAMEFVATAVGNTDDE